MCCVLGKLAPVKGAPAPCVVLRMRCPWPPGFCLLVCPLGVLCCVCGVLGHLAPVHQCAHWMSCICDVLGHLAPVHRCARSASCVACGVSRATWLLLTGVPAQCVVLGVRCPWQLDSCSPVFPLDMLCMQCLWPLGCCSPLRMLDVLYCLCPGPWPLGSCSTVCPLVCCVACAVSLCHLAPLHRCVQLVCAVCLATSLLITGVHVWGVALRVQCPWPLGCRSLVVQLGVLCCMCGFLGQLTPVQRCVRSASCVDCAVTWATWLLFTGVPAQCVVLSVRCPGPLGSCSPVCPLDVLCMRCLWPLGFCSLVCRLAVLCCVCRVLGH